MHHHRHDNIDDGDRRDDDIPTFSTLAREQTERKGRKDIASLLGILNRVIQGQLQDLEGGEFLLDRMGEVIKANSEDAERHRSTIDRLQQDLRQARLDAEHYRKVQNLGSAPFYGNVHTFMQAVRWMASFEGRQMWQQGNQKIGVIVKVRQLTGCGLKEAKDFVEGMEEYLRAQDDLNDPENLEGFGADSDRAPLTPTPATGRSPTMPVPGSAAVEPAPGCCAVPADMPKGDTTIQPPEGMQPLVGIVSTTTLGDDPEQGAV